MELPNHVQCRVEPNRPSLRLSIRDALLVEKLCQEWHRADDDTTGKSKFKGAAHTLFILHLHIVCSLEIFTYSALSLSVYLLHSCAEVFTQTHTQRHLEHM